MEATVVSSRQSCWEEAVMFQWCCLTKLWRCLSCAGAQWDDVHRPAGLAERDAVCRPDLQVLWDLRCRARGGQKWGRELRMLQMHSITLKIRLLLFHSQPKLLVWKKALPWFWLHLGLQPNQSPSSISTNQIHLWFYSHVEIVKHFWLCVGDISEEDPCLPHARLHQQKTCYRMKY